ncbi:ATP-dependent DNA-helicase PIF1 [Sesbania bispinosa]|nr:ATP-dependent DNA-helicase PIF1 [Sesbania bispinosa]
MSINYIVNRRFSRADLHIPPDELHTLCLLEVNKLLMANDKKLKDFHSMPHPTESTFPQYANILIFNKLNFNPGEMKTLHDDCLPKLNAPQRHSKDGEATIDIPQHMLIPQLGDPIMDVVSFTYPDMIKNCGQTVLQPSTFSSIQSQMQPTLFSHKRLIVCIFQHHHDTQPNV